jgi:trans-aconitate methyltransferase
MRGHVEFDDFAEGYDDELNRGLAVSGESKEFFAAARIDWLAALVARLGRRPRTALDFGCGTGTSAPLLLDRLGVDSVLGVDVSGQSIDFARRRHASPRSRFELLADHVPHGDLDLAFCNGVFHHIPLAERAGAVAHVYRSLKPGGLWAFFENNPLNPGTRLIMRRLAFDRDANTLTAWSARRLLESGGFRTLAVDHLFVFPRALSPLRRFEPTLARLPIGAQYLVLAEKNAA